MRRKCQDVRAGNLHELRKPAVNVLAHKAIAETEAVLALDAELTPAACETWIDHHTIPHLHTLNASAHLDNVTGDVTATPEREGGFQTRDPLADEQIKMVQGAGPDADQQFVRTDLG